MNDLWLHLVNNICIGISEASWAEMTWNGGRNFSFHPTVAEPHSQGVSSFQFSIGALQGLNLGDLHTTNPNTKYLQQTYFHRWRMSLPYFQIRRIPCIFRVKIQCLQFHLAFRYNLQYHPSLVLFIFKFCSFHHNCSDNWLTWTQDNSSNVKTIWRENWLF